MERLFWAAAIVLASILFYHERARGDSGPSPADYPLQLWLQASPVEDRLYVRAINVSSSNFTLDVETLGKLMFLSARPDAETAANGKPIPFSGHSGIGPLMTFGGRPPEPFPVVTTITLTPDQYIGCSLPFSDQPWIVAARKAIANAIEDKLDWTVHAVAEPNMKDAAGQIVPVPDARVLSSNQIELSRALLAAVGRTTRPKKPAATETADTFPFATHMAISDDDARLQIEVICEHPRPKGFLDKKTVPAGANLDTSCVNPAAIVWTLTVAGHPTPAPLFKTENPTTQPDPGAVAASGALYLPANRFLGTSVLIRNAPFFPSMQRFFDTSKDLKAACTLVARLDVRSPGLRATDAASSQVLNAPELLITRDLFERIVAAP